MVGLRSCVFLFIFLVQYYDVYGEPQPSLLSVIYDLLSDDDSDDSDDSDDIFGSDEDSDVPSTNKKPPLFNLTLPPTTHGMKLIVRNTNGEIAINLDSLLSGSPAGVTAAATTPAATTAAAKGGAASSTTPKA